MKDIKETAPGQHDTGATNKETTNNIGQNSSFSSSSDFIESIKPKIAQRLSLDNPKAKVNGYKFNGIACPQCKQHEAFTDLDKGLMIFCHRNNECGASTPIKKIYPDIFGNFVKNFKPTKEDPKRPATAYLQSRGIKTEGLEYSLGIHYADDGGKHHTVMFNVDEETKFHRFIDYQGKDKTRNIGPITGKVYKAYCEENPKVIYITEGIIDALSFKQSGKSTIAVLGSSNLPERFYLDNKDINYIIALDNDSAGHKGIKKHAVFFYDNKISFDIILTPEGKDWNDLLQANRLGAVNFEYYKFLGRLFRAGTALQYYQIYCSYYDKTMQLIFPFGNQTFIGTTKIEKKADLASENPEENKDKKSYFTSRLANCSLEIVYTTINSDKPNEPITDHLIKIKKHDKSEASLKFSSNDFASQDLFKKKLLSVQSSYYGDSKDLLSIFEYLDDKIRPIIRYFDYVGYDLKSGCYVYPDFLYDKTGVRHNINNEGYFETFNIAPLLSKDDKASFISGLEEIDLKLFIEQLYGAYGSRGLIVFSFYIASLFSHLIYEKYRQIPILSLYGEAHSGKSDLTTACRNCFFFLKEGLNSKGTKKGIARNLAKFISAVTSILEGQESDIFKIDILDLYHRGNLINNATYTNDKNTIQEVLQACLQFVQNPEVFFKTEQELTRVISLQFKKDQNNDQTKEFHSKLKSYSQNQLAYIGHSILSNRKYFEQNIIQEIEEVIKEYKKNETLKSMDRVRFNYSMILGTLNCFLDCFNFPDDKLKLYLKNVSDTLLELARKTAQNCEGNSLIADEFFSLLLKLTEVDQNGYKFYDDELRINKALAESAINQVHKKTWNDKELREALKSHKGFICYKSARLYSNTEKCFIFSKAKVIESEVTK